MITATIIILAVCGLVGLFVKIDETIANVKSRNFALVARKHLEREAKKLGMGEDWVEKHLEAMTEHFRREHTGKGN
jgi:cobalamin biosynthesis protein CbiD